MATYFSGMTDQRDDLPMEKHHSYQSTGFPNNLMYLNHPYPELSSANSLNAHSYGDSQSMRTRDEMLFIPPTSDPAMVGHHSYSPKPFTAQNVEQNLQYQEGLSLSLAMQTYHEQYTNSGFSSLMATQINEDKGVEYLSFGLAGDNLERPISLREMNFTPHIRDAGSIYNSKYLKATRELLDEVVSVHTTFKQPEKPSLHSFGLDEDTDMKSSCSGTGISSDGHKSTTSAERLDLENKMTKLFSMLDEVDKRFKQYYQQMQGVVSSFEMTAGLGAARPYTALALRTISCQFRCLRDAIKKQIQVTRQSLGERGSSSSSSQGERLYRLRYVDQKLRQQRSLQQFGMMRQPWRPQRGLPENAVSVLRAWLFEHFLHPYPKDSEKSMLARQTGLTRSQVANWFINARVRLWKPMIEDMYKEEFGDTEGGSTASPEQLTCGAAKDKSASEERDDEETHGSGFNDLQREIAEQHTTLSNQVSLALGLQQNQNSNGGGAELRGDEKTASSMDIGKVDYYYMDQQERFANSHLLSDFVV